jgi:hypothetical protein
VVAPAAFPACPLSESTTRQHICIKQLQLHVAWALPVTLKCAAGGLVQGIQPLTNAVSYQAPPRSDHPWAACVASVQHSYSSAHLGCETPTCIAFPAPSCCQETKALLVLRAMLQMVPLGPCQPHQMVRTQGHLRLGHKSSHSRTCHSLLEYSPSPTLMRPRSRATQCGCCP